MGPALREMRQMVFLGFVLTPTAAAVEYAGFTGGTHAGVLTEPLEVALVVVFAIKFLAARAAEGFEMSGKRITPFRPYMLIEILTRGYLIAI